MTITPASATVERASDGSVGTQQYTAYGTFVNPSETRDITSQVTWSTDGPDVGAMAGPTHPGLVVGPGACGTTNVKATAGSDLMGGTGTSGAVMTAFATFKVTDPNATTDPLCK